MSTFTPDQFSLSVESDTPGVFIVVNDIASYSRDTSQTPLRMPIMGGTQAQASLLLGAPEDKFAVDGIWNAGDPGQEILRDASDNQTPVTIQAFFDGATIGVTMVVYVTQQTSKQTPDGFGPISFAFTTGTPVVPKYYGLYTKEIALADALAGDERLVPFLTFTKAKWISFVSGYVSHPQYGQPMGLMDARAQHLTGRLFSHHTLGTAYLGWAFDLRTLSKLTVKIRAEIQEGANQPFFVISNRDGSTRRSIDARIDGAGLLTIMVGDGGDYATVQLPWNAEASGGAAGLNLNASFDLAIVFDGSGTGNVNRLKAYYSLYDPLTRTWGAVVQPSLTFSGTIPATLTSATSAGAQTYAIGIPGALPPISLLDSYHLWPNTALTATQVATDTPDVTVGRPYIRHEFNGDLLNAGTGKKSGLVAASFNTSTFGDNQAAYGFATDEVQYPVMVRESVNDGNLTYDATFKPPLVYWSNNAAVTNHWRNAGAYWRKITDAASIAGYLWDRLSHSFKSNWALLENSASALALRIAYFGAGSFFVETVNGAGTLTASPGQAFAEHIPPTTLLDIGGARGARSAGLVSISDFGPSVQGTTVGTIPAPTPPNRFWLNHAIGYDGDGSQGDGLTTVAGVAVFAGDLSSTYTYWLGYRPTLVL